MSLARPEGRPRYAWWRRLRPSQAVPWETARSIPELPKPRASPHLEWAKQVRTQQRAWLQHHCKICKPLPKVKGSKERGDETVLGIPTLFGSVSNWAQDLRVEKAPAEAEELRLFHQRRNAGLVKLQAAQRRWRQGQKQRRRRKQREVQEPTWEAPTLRLDEFPSSLNATRASNAETGLAPLAELNSERPESSIASLASSSEDDHLHVQSQVIQKSLLRRGSVQRLELLSFVDTLSAKDVTSGDLNFEELFDASDPEPTEEQKKDQQLASLSGDYLASTLMSRNDEPPELEAEVSATPPSGMEVAELKEQFAAAVRQRSQAWRQEFPLEVLNQLTAAFETWREEDSRRSASLRSMNHVLRYLLGWPPSVLQQVLEDPDADRLTFASLSDFLKLVKHALEEAEMVEPDVLWSDWDLHLVRESFRKYSVKTSNTMPVVHLFQAVAALGFEELHLEDSERQRWLAGITKQVLARKDLKVPVELSRRESLVPPPPRAGAGAHVTFRDFLRIASRALRESEKEHRADEFQEECKAIQALNYGLLEVEDMRELHGTFCAIRSSMNGVGGKGNLDAMQELLRRCGVHADPLELPKLRSVLKIKGKEKVLAQEGEPVSFMTFLRWMRDIRDLGLEGSAGLRTGKDITMEELEKRRGFHTGMLKELLAEFDAGLA